jgi:thioredoxin 1
MPSITNLTTENFDQVIQSEKRTVIVDFYADWCVPCKMIVPILEQIAADRDDAVVYKVNTDTDGQLAERFSISSIPYVVSFKDGQKYGQVIGAQSKDAYLALI